MQKKKVNMKKTIYLFAVILFMVACKGEENEPQNSAVSKEVNSIWKALNGSYKGVYYIFDTENIWYTETITFHPYSETKQLSSVVDGNITAFGTADIADTRFLEISGVYHCYYSIVVKYQGATPYISFYKYGEDGSIINKEDRRNIADISSLSFRMWSYGLTEENNSHIYNKE